MAKSRRPEDDGTLNEDPIEEVQEAMDARPIRHERFIEDDIDNAFEFYDSEDDIPEDEDDDVDDDDDDDIDEDEDEEE